MRRGETGVAFTRAGRRGGDETIAGHLLGTLHLLFLHLVGVGTLRLPQLLDRHEPHDQRGFEEVLLVASLREKPARAILHADELRGGSLRAQIPQPRQAEGVHHS